MLSPTEIVDHEMQLLRDAFDRLRTHGVELEVVARGGEQIPTAKEPTTKVRARKPRVKITPWCHACAHYHERKTKCVSFCECGQHHLPTRACNEVLPDTERARRATARPWLDGETDLSGYVIREKGKSK